jgi:hemolysin activation/secretion protein
MKNKSSVSSINTLVIFSLLLLSFICVNSALAQDVPKPAEVERIKETFKEKIFPKSTFEPVVPETPESMPAQEMQEIKFILKNIELKGATVYKKHDLLPLFNRYINKEISLVDVYRIAAKITAKYRNEGYILSQAIVPPQKIKDGVVEIQVIEGFIDTVHIKGSVRGPEELLSSYSGELTQQPLQAKHLERYLLLINDLPGVKVKSVLTPSKENKKASNLTLMIEHKTVDGYASIDNRGSRFNGPLQNSIGFNFNSIFNQYERTGIRVIAANPTEELLYVGLSHESQVLNEGTKMLYTGSITSTEPGHTLKSYNVQGDSVSASVMLRHPFIRSRGKNLFSNIGLSFLNSETDILGAKNAEDKLRVLSAGFTYDAVDSMRGINLFSLNLHQGLSAFGATKSGAANKSRANGKGSFTKLTGDVQRLQKLISRWSLLVSGSWQYSFDPLLASEEFGVGGSVYGRGYDSSEITGDHGIAAKVELQYSFATFPDFQVYSFYDYGTIEQKNPTAAEDAQEQLYSAGGGVRYNVTESISGYIEADKPLAENVSAEGDKDWRVYFRTVLRF